MADKQKILVCGDVDGRFRTLFSRVESINKKNGPFDFLLCVGNFFGRNNDDWDSYKTGDIKVPVPTYVLGPNDPRHTPYYPDIDGCELCPNVNYLGKRGLYRGSSGLKMAYVSGIDGPGGGSRHSSSSGSSNDQPEHFFSEADVTAVRDACTRSSSGSFRGIDILLTSQWPHGVLTGINSQQITNDPRGSKLISWLAAQVKPRYHFCAMDGIHFERPPYRNHPVEDGDAVDFGGGHATRFIALAGVGNSQKKKWLYAFSVIPLERMAASELCQRTTDETPCPYPKHSLLPSATMSSEQPTQFFFDMNPGRRKKRPGTNKGQDEGFEKKRQLVGNQELCWFCLASPQVEKHLVISIGSEAYLALAKGGLVPDHVLILPVAHHQSASAVPESVRKEIKQFKLALQKFFAKRLKVPVFFERNFKTSHLQIQVVPAPAAKGPELKEAFEECAQKQGIQLDELPVHAELEQIAPPGTPYFHVELPSGDKLFHRARRNFPLQFGREVMASKNVLNLPGRADWRDCSSNPEEEAALTKDFRTAFQPFDFTL
ncbi:CWF19-like protein 1 [Hetaerina americana]|uniref:CWF19-like protein 1 n=1 Tax=Hetaerina americana TaxID=62018 RepID=UPI003A7F2121